MISERVTMSDGGKSDANPGNADAGGPNAVASEDASNERAVVSQDASKEKAVVSEDASKEKAAASEDASKEKAVASEYASKEKAVASEYASKEKAVASEYASKQKPGPPWDTPEVKVGPPPDASKEKVGPSPDASKEKAVVSEDASKEKSVASDDAPREEAKEQPAQSKSLVGPGDQLSASSDQLSDIDDFSSLPRKVGLSVSLKSKKLTAIGLTLAVAIWSLVIWNSTRIASHVIILTTQEGRPRVSVFSFGKTLGAKPVPENVRHFKYDDSEWSEAGSTTAFSKGLSWAKSVIRTIEHSSTPVRIYAETMPKGRLLTETAASIKASPFLIPGDLIVLKDRILEEALTWMSLLVDSSQDFLESTTTKLLSFEDRDNLLVYKTSHCRLATFCFVSADAELPVRVEVFEWNRDVAAWWQKMNRTDEFIHWVESCFHGSVKDLLFGREVVDENPARKPSLPSCTDSVKTIMERVFKVNDMLVETTQDIYVYHELLFKDLLLKEATLEIDSHLLQELFEKACTGTLKAPAKPYLCLNLAFLQNLIDGGRVRLLLPTKPLTAWNRWMLGAAVKDALRLEAYF